MLKLISPPLHDPLLTTDFQAYLLRAEKISLVIKLYFALIENLLNWIPFIAKFQHMFEW